MSKRFPTFEDVAPFAPADRKGYMAAQQAYIAHLGGNDPDGSRVASALLEVAYFNMEGQLEPPLPVGLGRLVMNAADFLGDGSAYPRDGYDPRIAAGILQVVVEHGYRPASLDQPT